MHISKINEQANSTNKAKEANPEKELLKLITRPYEIQEENSEAELNNEDLINEFLNIQLALMKGAKFPERVEDKENFFKALSDITGLEVTPERENSMKGFFKELGGFFHGIQSRPEDYDNAVKALDKTGDGKLDAKDLIEVFKSTKPDDIQVMPPEGTPFEVIDGGVDGIAGSKMTLRINGKLYTVSYSPFGINYDSLKAKDGSDIDPEVLKTIKDNEKEIQKTAMKMSYHKDPKVAED